MVLNRICSNNQSTRCQKAETTLSILEDGDFHRRCTISERELWSFYDIKHQIWHENFESLPNDRWYLIFWGAISFDWRKSYLSAWTPVQTAAIISIVWRLCRKVLDCGKENNWLSWRKTIGRAGAALGKNWPNYCKWFEHDGWWDSGKLQALFKEHKLWWSTDGIDIVIDF